MNLSCLGSIKKNLSNCILLPHKIFDRLEHGAQVFACDRGEKCPEELIPLSALHKFHSFGRPDEANADNDSS